MKKVAGNSVNGISLMPKRKPIKKFKGITKDAFIAHCNKNNKGKGYLYIVKIYDISRGVYFIKVGVTSRDVSERMRELPFESIEIIKIKEGNGGYIYDLEQKIHKKLRSKGYKYIPSIRFGGRSECYIIECEHSLLSI